MQRKRRERERGEEVVKFYDATANARLNRRSTRDRKQNPSHLTRSIFPRARLCHRFYTGIRFYSSNRPGYRPRSSFSVSSTSSFLLLPRITTVLISLPKEKKKRWETLSETNVVQRSNWRVKRKQWKKRNVPFNNFLNANFLFHVVIVSEELHKNVIASTVCCKHFSVSFLFRYSSPRWKPTLFEKRWKKLPLWKLQMIERNPSLTWESFNQLNRLFLSFLPFPSPPSSDRQKTSLSNPLSNLGLFSSSISLALCQNEPLLLCFLSVSIESFSPTREGTRSNLFFLASSSYRILFLSILCLFLFIIIVYNYSRFCL